MCLSHLNILNLTHAVVGVGIGTAGFSTLIILPMLHSCNQTRSSWPACATQHSTAQPSTAQPSTGAGRCCVPGVDEAGFPADPQAGGPAVCTAGVAGLDGPPGS